MNTVYKTNSPEETEALGVSLGSRLRSGQVLAMTGDLAAGKTTFLRGLARGMGLADDVTSPTFAIVHEYREGKLPLFHFDMYRLGSSEELFDIGWEDYLARGAVCAVEWSEKIDDAFYGDETVVRIEKLGDSDRQITVEEGRG